MRTTRPVTYLGIFSLCVLGWMLCRLGVAADDLASNGDDAKKTPLPRAHAHNDYLHSRPLLDALASGFCSVEADIFLVDGELLVAHTRFELDRAKTLRKLYLDPLRQRIRDNGGSVHGDGQQFTLLIDLKADGAATYRALDKMLEEYSEVFAHTNEAGEQVAGPVLAIISGDRPTALVEADATRYVGIDGRLSDLNSTQSPALLPLISDNWNQHFVWRGSGELSAEDKQKLGEVVAKVHTSGRRIRFWAVPDNELSWRLLDEAGVDLINTDKLTELEKYLRSR